MNGNRANKGIRLAHWNAGSAHLANKMHEIEQVVSDHHPHLLGISESNYKKMHDIEILINSILCCRKERKMAHNSHMKTKLNH